MGGARPTCLRRRGGRRGRHRACAARRRARATTRRPRGVVAVRARCLVAAGGSGCQRKTVGAPGARMGGGRRGRSARRVVEAAPVGMDRSSGRWRRSLHPAPDRTRGLARHCLLVRRHRCGGRGAFRRAGCAAGAGHVPCSRPRGRGAWRGAGGAGCARCRPDAGRTDRRGPAGGAARARLARTRCRRACRRDRMDPVDHARRRAPDGAVACCRTRGRARGLA